MVFAPLCNYHKVNWHSISVSSAISISDKKYQYSHRFILLLFVPFFFQELFDRMNDDSMSYRTEVR